MNATKTLSTVGVGAAIVVGSMLAVNAASAHGGGTAEQQAERTSAIAERFNLDESEVEAFMEERRAERQVERLAERAEQLAALVADGTLTQEQADELTALRDEIQAEVSALKESDADREEIKTLMDENRAAIESWAEAEGLDLESLRIGGEGRKGHRGGDKATTDTEESTEVETSSVEL